MLKKIGRRRWPQYNFTCEFQVKIEADMTVLEKSKMTAICISCKFRKEVNSFYYKYNVRCLCDLDKLVLTYSWPLQTPYYRQLINMIGPREREFLSKNKIVKGHSMTFTFDIETCKSFPQKHSLCELQSRKS